jgi:hypothetical protein
MCEPIYTYSVTIQFCRIAFDLAFLNRLHRKMYGFRFTARCRLRLCNLLVLLFGIALTQTIRALLLLDSFHSSSFAQKTLVLRC